MTLLAIDNLSVQFERQRGPIHVLDQVSLTLQRGERLGIIGESGSGKSMLAFAIMGLLTHPAKITSGTIHYDDISLLACGDKQLRQLRGNKISLIPQDPTAALNPLLTIGQQLIESLRAHRNLSRRDARTIALQKLRRVRIEDPEHYWNYYPHQLSGGMLQRIIIAAALLLDPDIIIADEPTTALDITTAADITQLLLELCQFNHVGLLLISHDLTVISQVTQQLAVLYAGQVLEQGPTIEVINDAQHPYTQALINAIPQQTPYGHKLQQIPGAMPSTQERPSGCIFHPRCRYVMETCRRQPPMHYASGNSQVTCHLFSAAEINRDATFQQWSDHDG